MPSPHGRVVIVPEHSLPSLLADRVEPATVAIHVAALAAVGGSLATRHQLVDEPNRGRLLEQVAERGVLVQDDEPGSGVVGVDALHGAQQERVVDLHEAVSGVVAEPVVRLGGVDRQASHRRHVRHHHITEAEVVKSLQVRLDSGDYLLDVHKQFLESIPTKCQVVG